MPDPFMPYFGAKNAQRFTWYAFIRGQTSRMKTWQYREPFLGGGSVALDVLRPGDSAWLNDAWRPMACLWTSVLLWPNELCNMMSEGSQAIHQYYGRELDDLERH